MAISTPIAAAVIAAGTTAYTVNRQRAAEEAQGNAANEIAADQLKEAQAISLPNTTATAANLQASEQQAASAGGTITSNPGQGGMPVGDGANQPRKQLIGS